MRETPKRMRAIVGLLALALMLRPVISTRCAHCERQTYMELEWGRFRSTDLLLSIAATCAYCGKPSVAFGNPSTFRPYDTDHLGEVEEYAAKTALQWFPRVGETRDIEDVPPHITRAAQEAYSSASVGNYMAAILMARTVIEATAKHLGVTKGDLAAKINSLRDDHGLSKNVADQAHEVRFAGNDMAHGDIKAPLEESIDAEDADEILELMAAVLNGIFQEPARLARAREKRSAKRAREGGAS